MKDQSKHLCGVSEATVAGVPHPKSKRAKRTLMATIVSSVLTAAVVLASTVNFADKSGQIFRSSRITDTQIAEDPDKVIRHAQESLDEFGNWRVNPTVRTEHADEIAGWLLVTARAKEAKNMASEDVLKDYYGLIERFPDFAGIIEVLCKVVHLDKENGLAYATNFLEKSGDPGHTTAFYARLIKSSLAESDYLNVEKYVKLFIDKYGSDRDGLKFMAQIMASVGPVQWREQLAEIIERNVLENPNSPLCCAVFRYRILVLSKADATGALEMAESVRQRFPGTKLAVYATTVLADNEYQQGNFVFALEAFKPAIFTESKSETEIIEDIDNTVTLYNANTLRPQGVDSGKIYESLAKYTHGLGRNTVAVHCYRQSAKAKGFSIEAFERAAPEDTKYCNTGPENEIWFWKGLFTAEEGDLIAAAMIYERFLKADSSGILAAAAYYNTARAKMALGWYVEAKETIAKAKSISPCLPVIKLEQELAKIKTVKF